MTKRATSEPFKSTNPSSSSSSPSHSTSPPSSPSLLMHKRYKRSEPTTETLLSPQLSPSPPSSQTSQLPQFLQLSLSSIPPVVALPTPTISLLPSSLPPSLLPSSLSPYSLMPSVAVNKKGKIPVHDQDQQNNLQDKQNKTQQTQKQQIYQDQQKTPPSQQLPMAPLEGELLYVTDAKELKEVCERLKGDGTKDSVCILGLDCEWTPSFQKGQADNNRTAVIQLSSESLNVVFHVSAFLPPKSRKLPAPLAELLENNEILKIVVGNQDVKRIKKDFGIAIKYADLQKLHPRLNGVGVKTMTEEFMQQTVKKTSKLPRWETCPLPQSQLLYAALDSQLTRQLYFKIKGNPNIPIFNNSNYANKLRKHEQKTKRQQINKPKTDQPKIDQPKMDNPKIDTPKIVAQIIIEEEL